MKNKKAQILKFLPKEFIKKSHQNMLN